MLDSREGGVLNKLFLYYNMTKPLLLCRSYVPKNVTEYSLTFHSYSILYCDNPAILSLSQGSNWPKVVWAKKHG